VRERECVCEGLCVRVYVANDKGKRGKVHLINDIPFFHHIFYSHANGWSFTKQFCPFL